MTSPARHAPWDTQRHASEPEIPLWARPELRAAAGDTLRPGGLELTSRLADAMGLCPGMRVLDAGCGPGATVRLLRRRYGVHALGLDRQPSPSRGTLPRHLPMVQGRVHTLPLPDSSLHAIFCECVLSLQPDPVRVLREFQRVLRPGGFLGLTDLYLPEAACSSACKADTPPLPRQKVKTSCAERAPEESALRKSICRAGMQLIQFEDHSFQLRTLAAKLAWTGCAPRCNGERRPGYCLVLARKPLHDTEEQPPCSTTWI
ncbi:MAG: DVU_1556 family methyltransferase [Desulfovibrio sp.]